MLFEKAKYKLIVRLSLCISKYKMLLLKVFSVFQEFTS